MPKIDPSAQTARREHILDAAEKCFTERGFHSTSMHDICRVAGVSPGALYTYFSSKEQLIAGMCDREKSTLVENLAVVAEAKDFMAALSALAETYCVKQSQEKLRLHVEINAEALRNPVIGEIVRSIDTFVVSSFERLLARAHEEGRIHPAVNVGALAQVMAVLGDGMCWQRAMNKDFNASAVMPLVMCMLSTVLKPAEEQPRGAEKSAETRTMGLGMKIKTGAAIVAALLAMGTAGTSRVAYAADEPKPAAAAIEGPAVSVVAVAKTSFVQSVLVTGSLVARQEVLVSPQIDGYRLTELLAEEGDRVVAGQVLARLDRSTLDTQLAQLEAQRTRADAAIAQARSNIAQAEANQKQAEAAFERARDLVKTGTTSQAVFDEREAAARTATATVRSALDGLRVSEADKTAIEAQIREANLRIGYTEIKAPTDGLVSRRTARLGGVVSASVGDPLFRIIAKGEIEMAAEVPEIYLPKMTVGMPARIEVASLPERKGTIRLIAPEVDPATRLGRVRIFIGDDKELRIGTFGRATIDVAKSDGLGVPSSAILSQGDSLTVQVVKDGKVETRRVTAGLVSGGNAEIVHGLAEGELVVLRSGTLLRDGDAVRPVTVDKMDKTAVNEAK
jgi:RND family efflux transporter MFP subunit